MNLTKNNSEEENKRNKKTGQALPKSPTGKLITLIN